MAIGDEHTYLAASRAGLGVIEVSNPGQIREVASGAPPFGEANSVALMDRYVFVSDGGRILAFDAGDTAWGEPLGEIRVERRGWSDPLVAEGGYVYAGAEKRFVGIDARDPGDMQPVATVLLDAYLPGMKVVGQYLYLANKARFRVYDVSDPEVP